MKTKLAFLGAVLALLNLMAGGGAAGSLQLPAELQNHGAIVLLIDPQNGAILDANASAAAFYGFPIPVLRTMHIQDINMFDPAEVAEEMRRAKTEQRNYFLFPHRLAGGDIRTVEVYSSPYRVADGRTLLLSIIHDATDKALVEAENLEYRTRLEALVAQRTKEALTAHSRTTLIILTAPLLLLGLLFWLYRKHRDVKLYRRQYELEQQRNQALQELSHLVAAIPSLLISLDARKHIVRWNQKAEDILRLGLEDVRGRLLQDCPVPWKSEIVSQALEECERTGYPVRVDDLPFTQRGGEPGFLGVSVSMIPNKIDDQRGFLLLGRDITRTRLLENQLLQAQKMESIGHLAAGIAHEINTPIQFVGSNLSFLRDSCVNIRQMVQHYDNLLEAGRNLTELGAPVETVERYKADIDLDYLLREIGTSLEEVQSGVDRVAGIVRSMRMLSHPGKQGKAAVDLNGILESVVILSRSEWKQHVAMDIDLQPDLPMVVCMAAEISQAVLNLLVNAIQAVLEQIESGSIVQGRIGIVSRQDGNWVEIRVTDNGGGISPEHQSRIFDPFFTTKAVGKGTGQGLAIAHAIIVGKHGGTITFITGQGSGTTFIVRLPVFDADQANQPQKVGT